MFVLSSNIVGIGAALHMPRSVSTLIVVPAFAAKFGVRVLGVAYIFRIHGGM